MKDYVVHIRLSKEAYEAFRKFCTIRKWTQSTAGCEIISDYLSLSDKNREIV